MGELVLTAEGVRALEEELRRLAKIGRAEFAERLRRTRAFAGDLDENREFLEAKGEQERLEERIATIAQQLRDARLVDPGESPPGEISLEKYVTLEDLDSGERERYRLVGPPEADPTRGKLSIESPVGQAIVEHRVGETVLVEAPHQRRRLKIVAVRQG